MISIRGEDFSFTLQRAEVSWRGIPITLSDLQKGDLISITYTGLIQEISPAVILDVDKKYRRWEMNWKREASDKEKRSDLSGRL